MSAETPIGTSCLRKLNGNCLIGIDEAGRGPVLGPMVYGACFCQEGYLDKLKTMPFADSKQLTEAQRDNGARCIAEDGNLGYCVESIEATTISQAMLGRNKTSLNELAFEATCALVLRVQEAGNLVMRVYVDTVGDPATHASRLGRAFPAVEFVVEKKADAKYPIVSAASIVAKVTRDRQLTETMAQYVGGDKKGSGFGSGYPGDADTVAWLAGNIDPVFGPPPVARYSWSTVEKLMDKRCVEAGFGEDMEGGQQTLAFGGKRMAGPTQATGRHSFFRARKLQRLPLECL